MGSAVVERDGNWRRVPASVNCADDLCASASTILLVKHIADTLERHYPGWLWAVKPDEGGGIIDIFSLRISAKRGYTLHTSVVQEDVGLKCVVRAGGEYLERFGFRRVRYSSDEWHRRALVMGQFIPDVSDQRQSARRAMRTDILQNALVSGHAKIATNPNIGLALKHKEALCR